MQQFLLSTPRLELFQCFSGILQPTPNFTPSDANFWSSLPTTIEELHIDMTTPGDVSYAPFLQYCSIFIGLTMAQEQGSPAAEVSLSAGGGALPVLKDLVIEQLGWRLQKVNPSDPDGLSTTVLGGAYPWFVQMIRSRRDPGLFMVEESSAKLRRNIEHVTFHISGREWRPTEEGPGGAIGQSESIMRQLVEEGLKVEISLADHRVIDWGHGAEYEVLPHQIPGIGTMIDIL